ncbi:MAG TPA: ferrous iron transport protein A [Planctomycetaceae bacterium]|nr:ferrous iron transport protein A [Planctomycetaceae bacterium]
MPTLCDLPLGATATIRDIAGEDAVAIRLMEMGLTDGEAITLLGAAPLGDPLEFSVRGYRLSLRKSEAARVIVDFLTPGS